MPASFQLVVRSGPNLGKVYPLEKGEILIGRDLNNDIAISDPEISRRHARLYVQGSTYVLEDLGSTNGTFVGGQRLTGAYPLRLGEVITFGERITFVFEGVPSAADIESTPASKPLQAPSTPGSRVITSPLEQPVDIPPLQTPAPPPAAPVPPFTTAPEVPPPQAVYQPARQHVQQSVQGQTPLVTPPPPNVAYQPVADQYAAEYYEEEKPRSKTTVVLLIVLAVILLVACACVAITLWNAPLEFWCQFPVWPEGKCP